jgi:hypothetical protein
MNKNTNFLLAITLLIFVSCSVKHVHIPASKSVIGIWRQTGLKRPLTNKYVRMKAGYYKILNADGTYYTLLTWTNNTPIKNTTIGKYGSYTVISDSTILEHTTKHETPKFNGADDNITYKLIDDNTMTVGWENEQGLWIYEEWTRVPFKNLRKLMNKQN